MWRSHWEVGVSLCNIGGGPVNNVGVSLCNIDGGPVSNVGVSLSNIGGGGLIGNGGRGCPCVT